MSTTNKTNTWKLILQLIVAALSAIATTLGVTSCMGANVYFKQTQLWQNLFAAKHKKGEVNRHCAF